MILAVPLVLVAMYVLESFSGSVVVMWLNRALYGYALAALAWMFYSLRKAQQFAGSFETWDRQMRFVRDLEQDSTNSFGRFVRKTGMIGMLLIALSLIFGFNWLALGTVLIALTFYNLSVIWSPLVVLFLGGSSTGQSLYRELLNAAFPHQVYSMLAVRVHSGDPIFDDALMYARRPRIWADWRSIVNQLCQHARLIVVDTRVATSAVIEETERLLGSDVLFKTVFVVTHGAESPVLEQILGAAWRDRVSALVVSEDEINERVRYLTRDSARLPTSNTPLCARPNPVL